MSAAPSFAFAPNVTPGTFNDPPSPSADSSGDMLLFPANADATTRRAAHAKKKPENHIPRPPNAFILFRSSFIKNQHVSSEVETNHSTLSKIIGLTWQNLPHEERQVWHAKAKAALEEHKRKFPQYAFRPLHTKGKGPTEKRKVREVEPKDLKRCAKIAQLLIEGKKGADLDAAIQEFDRHHVPEVVTRFEAPITARHYRRSSSAPAPDTEHSNPPFLSPEPTTPSKRKTKRSSSSQPEVPRTPAYECSTPSPPPPSEPDTESDYYSSPSSPYVPTPSYSLPPANPSFDFSTFSFDSSANPAMTYQACDPLDQQGVFEAYSQDSQDSCVSAPEMFNLTIDTSFMDNCNWTTSSSPLSSMPGTPQTYSSVHTPCDPTSILDNYLSSDGHGYDPSAEFLPQHGAQLYPSGVPAFCAPTGIDMAYGTQDFGGVPPKGDFASFYGRPALDPVDAAAFAPTYLSSAPTFAI
ncbi:hypothetical protein L227DRAFT_502151 [Lentinus tigrinus ALCF2SS1-6]|uniref:HMG box domain-containing protein n=2 Tax=Lentinus tigrinus TaxID=5365 RepID=A0A5C2S8M4_9APHY|nr:hypothetical protein L227DRAFT_502151 [Lentinus tigrinus ALCF2SS1-6]